MPIVIHMYYKYFSQSLLCYFIFLTMSENFNFDEVHVYGVCVCGGGYCYLRNICLLQDCKEIYLYFLLRALYNLSQINLCVCCEVGDQV